jgi:hypothetical protein
VTGPGGGSWTIERQPGTWAVHRGAPKRPAAALVQLTSDCLWRVATRGIPVESAREQTVINAFNRDQVAFHHINGPVPADV